MFRSVTVLNLIYLNTYLLVKPCFEGLHRTDRHIVRHRGLETEMAWHEKVVTVISIHAL